MRVPILASVGAFGAAFPGGEKLFGCQFLLPVRVTFRYLLDLFDAYALAFIGKQYQQNRRTTAFGRCIGKRPVFSNPKCKQASQSKRSE